MWSMSAFLRSTFHAMFDLCHVASSLSNIQICALILLTRMQEWLYDIWVMNPEIICPIINKIIYHTDFFICTP